MSGRRRRRGALIGAIGLAVALVVAAFLVVAGVWPDTRKDIDLTTWLEPGDAWAESVMPGRRLATSELCTSQLPCLQALSSETLTMYRFDDRDDAVSVARSFGDDGYLTGWIAVHFRPGALSAADRSDVEYSIGCINTWVSEDGRDC